MTAERGRIDGVCIIQTERRHDERGWFARSYCARQFETWGLRLPCVQASIAYNEKPATLRGLHWQAAPYEESKLIRCLDGAIWDVVADLRPYSATAGQWEAFELSADNARALYVPEGCAHGYLTLTPNALVHYQMSAAYAPEASRGLRWDDPHFAIDWPLKPATISHRDRAWRDWTLQAGEIYAGCH